MFRSDMPSDDEIRSLCARVVKARVKEFEAAVAEPQAAIKQLLTRTKEPNTLEGD